MFSHLWYNKSWFVIYHWHFLLVILKKIQLLTKKFQILITTSIIYLVDGKMVNVNNFLFSVFYVTETYIVGVIEDEMLYILITVPKLYNRKFVQKQVSLMKQTIQMYISQESHIIRYIDK